MAAQTETLRDVVVVGGGAAGLSAALTLARARRRVTVVDAGQPRNAPADAVHGLLALDGVRPAELLARGRDEVLGYGGEIVAGEVVDVSCASYGFKVVLRDGAVLWTRRLLIATGLVDVLPDVPGVREQWGHGVLHCPYCHGWEVRDRRIGVLATDRMSAHKALLFRQWSADVVLFAGGRDLDAQERAQLDALDVPVAGRISRLEVDGDRLSGVRLDDGQVVAVDVVVVSTWMVARTEPFAAIGIEATSHPAGAFIEADALGKTAVPGVWAAGNVSDPSAQVSGAAADGARAAQHINADLVMDDLGQALAARADAPTHAPADEGPPMTHSFDAEYWDQIWSGDRAASMAAGQPNPHLVREVGDLAAGTAIDAGCGAGAEAIWLATHGWQVTAADIATQALDRAAERAGASGAAGQVQWVQADLSTWDPQTRYDLVTTSYAHPAMPQLEFYDRIATWVAPGGTLLIVGHLHREAIGGDEHGHDDGHDDGHSHRLGGDRPPSSASATASAITARLDPATWEVVTAQESHRTLTHDDGREATLHDVVVRATRHPGPPPSGAVSRRRSQGESRFVERGGRQPGLAQRDADGGRLAGWSTHQAGDEQHVAAGSPSGGHGAVRAFGDETGPEGHSLQPLAAVSRHGAPARSGVQFPLPSVEVLGRAWQRSVPLLSMPAKRWLRSARRTPARCRPGRGSSQRFRTPRPARRCG